MRQGFRFEYTTVGIVFIVLIFCLGVVGDLEPAGGVCYEVEIGFPGGRNVSLDIIGVKWNSPPLSARILRVTISPCLTLMVLGSITPDSMATGTSSASGSLLLHAAAESIAIRLAATIKAVSFGFFKYIGFSVN